MIYVYVLIKQRSTDADSSDEIRVFTTFAKALKAFNQAIKKTKSEMKDLEIDAKCEQDVDTDSETATFEVFDQKEYYYSSISIQRKELL